MRGNAGCGFESAAAAALALYLFVAQLDQAVAFAIAAYHFFLGAARFHGCLPLQSADLRLRAGESYGACNLMARMRASWLCRCGKTKGYAVIAGPDPAIHERARRQKTYVRMVRAARWSWMPGSSPGMTLRI